MRSATFCVTLTGILLGVDYHLYLLCLFISLVNYEDSNCLQTSYKMLFELHRFYSCIYDLVYDDTNYVQYDLQLELIIT